MTIDAIIADPSLWFDHPAADFATSDYYVTKKTA